MQVTNMAAQRVGGAVWSLRVVQEGVRSRGGVRLVMV